MLTDSSSVRGSTTSSSSDVMTLTTASSWCAIPASTRIRIVRLNRPHTRRIFVAPDCCPSYGFTVRGGKEFGIGFFIANVDRNSEADSKGLRAGDQILRINGFRFDDAIHKEFVQFVSNQDRLTLKVRGVGMVPTKDKESDKISWHVVKIASVSNTPSESSFHATIDRMDTRGRDINVMLNVAPRTKLGLGICKGPEWKPGIFVQFTKDKSVARESGLRPGDQILSVNSIDFSDVLFSEAVAVMKGSNKLDMMVRTGAGCDLFPGESSGYNSSASSVTGDQSPCWADAKAKRLTAVREEPTASPYWNESSCRQNDGSRANPLAEREHREINMSIVGGKELNKTIIKLSENGTSINNTYIGNTKSSLQKIAKESRRSLSELNAIPTPPPMANFSIETLEENYKNPKSNNNETKIVAVEVHKTTVEEIYKRQQATSQHSPSKQQNKNMLFSTMPSSATSAVKMVVQTPQAIAAVAAPVSNIGRDGNTVSSADGGSTLSSAITEELKKRKEKQKQRGGTLIAAANATSPTATNERHNCSNSVMRNNSQHYRPSPHQHQQQTPSLRHHQQQQQSLTESTDTLALRQTALKRVTSSAANCSERSNSSKSGINGGGGGGDQHSALMDEFKRAHQRMMRMKNGFQFHDSDCTPQERQEALKRTTIMEDDVNHRTSNRHFNTETKSASRRVENDSEVAQNRQHISNIPPPPPQFANSPPKTNHTTNNQKALQKSLSPISSTTAKQSSPAAQQITRAPSSPVPDYDNVQMRFATAKAKYGHAASSRDTTPHSSSHTNSSNYPTNRRTMRLGTVTIGEYESNPRKEPARFDFISTQKLNNDLNSEELPNSQSLHSELQNTLTRANLKKPNGHYHVEHQSNCPMQNHFSYNGTSADETRTTASNINASGPGGILKNGNRNSGSNTFTKNPERTIKFGN